MTALPDNVPRGQFAAAVGLCLAGFIAIIFASGSLAILGIGTLLVLASGGLGLKIGLDLWKETE